MLSTHYKAPCFALVDCNNFYVSCERVFNPALIGKPVVVLSNNDGCVISRSNEAKQLGIKMGEPYFKISAFCKKNQVKIFSSNFVLYGDMSNRVMQTLKNLCPEIEVYSVDEAFLRLDFLALSESTWFFNNLHRSTRANKCAISKNHADSERADTLVFDPCLYAIKIREIILQHVGIPVSIGIAPTKTLAKVANQIAKKSMSNGVFDLRSEVLRDIVMQSMPVEDLWGVGRRWAKKLHGLNIKTADQLTQKPESYFRKHFNVVMMRLVKELKGVSCISLEEIEARKNIICSRSFGDPVTTLIGLHEAISRFCAIACEKARKQKTKAQGVYVYFRTSTFDKEGDFYAASDMTTLVHPSNDTCFITATAKMMVKKLFQPGCKYKKAGVVLINLQPDHVSQSDFFQAKGNNNYPLMHALDTINQRFGRRSLFLASEGTHLHWMIKQEHRSPRYTTCWDELPKV